MRSQSAGPKRGSRCRPACATPRDRDRNRRRSRHRECCRPSGLDGLVKNPPGGSELGIAGAAGFREVEGGATRDALPSKTVVVRQLVHAAALERMRAADPGKVVVVTVDGVLRTVVRAAAP